MTTDPTDDRGQRERLARCVLIGVAVLLGAFVLFAYLSQPPQMGTSAEVFKTVDALYTAVRSRDERRLAQAERRLQGYREAGKLPSAAANALDAIIGTARAGSWQPAAERLHAFMRAQQR